MDFRIESHGIASVTFRVSLDDNAAQVNLLNPPSRGNEEFYQERERIAGIFNARSCTLKYVENFHGHYSQHTLQHLTTTADILLNQSIIDAQRHREMVDALQDMVAKVKIEYEAEVTRFAPFLSDFVSNISIKDFEKNLNKLPEDMPVDDSICRIKHIAGDLQYFRGNPMKIGSSWAYFLASEGALEVLINQLDENNANKGYVLASEGALESLIGQLHEGNRTKDYFIALHAGIVRFLEKYETELYRIIEEDIVKNADWFQQYYADYKTMIQTGTCPEAIRHYGPITNVNFGPLELFLPDRFFKVLDRSIL